jgi:hypothetical protein
MITNPRESARGLLMKFGMLIQTAFNSSTLVFDVGSLSLVAYTEVKKMEIADIFGIDKDSAAVRMPDLTPPTTLRRFQDITLECSAQIIDDYDRFDVPTLESLQILLQEHLQARVTILGLSCGKGHFQGPQGGCKPCAPGLYQSNLDFADSCTECPSDHMESPSGASSVSDCRCKIGFSWRNTSTVPVHNQPNSTNLAGTRAVDSLWNRVFSYQRRASTDTMASQCTFKS